MKHSFHCILRRSFRWYHNWHNHPFHQDFHWLVFVLIAFILTSFILQANANFVYSFEPANIYLAQQDSDILPADSIPFQPAQAPTLPNPQAEQGFGLLVNNFFNYALLVVGICVFVMIMWGGILWLTSAANPGNIATAKRKIWNAIIGAVILFSAYVILRTINPELVGGELILPGIEAPAPGGGIVDLISQGAAKRLLGASGVSFSTNADCGSQFHAQKNIQDVAVGSLPAVCSPNCSCIAGGTSGTVNLDPFMLDSLVALSQQGILFTVTSLSTGRHSTNSPHYQGRAADIAINSSDYTVWQKAVSVLNGRGFIAFCESVSGNPDPPCNLAVTDHIHLHR